MANLRANKIVSTTGSNAITGSVEFDGTGDYLSLADSDDFDIGLNNEPFTWEVWFNMTSPTTVTNNLGLNRGGGVAGWNSTDGHQYQAFHYTDNKLYWQFWNGTTNVSVTSDANLVSIGSWNHFAVTYDGTTTRGFLNGIQFPTTSTSNYAKPSSSNISRIGTEASGNNFGSKFQSNIRIIKGTALYTQNFIPPTKELKNIPGTVLLCCQDSKSATQEATGKTITVNGNATPRNFSPQVGFDGYVEFLGPTKISTENYFYLPTGNTEDRGRGRGVFTGGLNPGTPTNSINSIDYVSISSAGIAIDFGDLYSGTKRGSGSASSLTRGINGGGLSGPALTNIIEFITISSTSNSQDFGDLTSSRQAVGSASNNTRGLFSGGVTPTSVSTIDFITIASLGNAIYFGNLSAANSNQSCGLNSPTRGIFAGGTSNVIEFVNFASTGNTQDFGDISAGAIELPGVCSSSTRGILAGGELQPTGTLTNSISFITLASTGNSTNFGELSVSTRQISGTSNSVRGIFGGGLAPTVVNTISFVTIASTGNAQDFGDLTQAKSVSSACSDSHGGLG